MVVWMFDNIHWNFSIKNNAVDNSGELKYSKGSRYDEFATLTMQWANSADTQQGDTKIFSKKGNFYLMEADGEGSCIELASGTYKKVRNLYERVEQDRRKLHGNI